MKISAGLFCMSIFALSGCVSENVVLVNPRTGATVKCSAEGAGLMAAAASGIADECVRKYGPEGYVVVERLTPAERADLERRGALPR